MRAFHRAAEVGCDLLEFDCHLTRDGVVVIIHDDTLERTTNGRGYVRDHAWAELARLDAGRGERVPRLDEVTSWAREAAVTLSIEIKQPTPALGLPRYEGIERRVADVVRAHGLERRVLIHSFDHPTIGRLRDLLPDTPTAVSYGGGTFVDPLVLVRGTRATGVHPWWAWASPEVCAAAHAEDMHVHAWGTPEPPDPEVVATLVRAGVDSLDAADPRQLRAILDQLTRRTAT